MTSTYRLVMRSGPTVGKEYPIEKPEITIGRDLSSDVVINDAEVSRRHARMVQQGTVYTIEDLGSTNGTFINGQRLTGPYTLRAGEVVTFGEHITLVYEVAVVDAEATVVIPSAQHVAPQPQSFATTVEPVPQPIAQSLPPQPRPQPIPQAPIPTPMPVNPNEPAPKKKKFPVWVIIVVVAILLLMCICIGVVWYIDANSLWCDVAPFLFSGSC
jgi:predicted component of type VI protein secretion system